MQGGTYFRNEIGAALFFGGGNVKIILCESGTSGAGKADAAATGLQTKRIWYLCDGCGLEEQGKLF